VRIVPLATISPKPRDSAGDGASAGEKSFMPANETSHTDSSTLVGAVLQALTERIEGSLEGNESEYPPARRLLSMLAAEPLRPAPEAPRQLPVVRFWDTALDTLLRGDGAELARLLQLLTPRLHWFQGEHYTAATMGTVFMDNYALAELVGPRGLCRSPNLALGILLLGPETYYPPHRHPAEEGLYLLSGRGTWHLDRGATISLPPGGVVHIPAGSAHAFWSFDAPMAALYFCSGEVSDIGRLWTPAASAAQGP
jgi:mannose-6-phosphate isomerase-like protein (cupin superfamily)